MRIFTKLLTSGTSYRITSDKRILQWSVVPALSTTTFTITGTPKGIGEASTALSWPAGSGGYNSEIAPTSSVWDDVTITVGEGSLNFVATQD